MISEHQHQLNIFFMFSSFGGYNVPLCPAPLRVCSSNLITYPSSSLHPPAAARRFPAVSNLPRAHWCPFLQQPYSNGQLPNLTIRKEMLALMLMLPVQVDHLKRSGIGKVVMGLINCKEVGHWCGWDLGVGRGGGGPFFLLLYLLIFFMLFGWLSCLFLFRR